SRSALRRARWTTFSSVPPLRKTRCAVSCNSPSTSSISFLPLIACRSSDSRIGNSICASSRVKVRSDMYFHSTGRTWKTDVRCLGYVSIPNFEMRPRLCQRLLESVADQYGVVFPAHGVRILDLRTFLDTLAPVLRVIELPVEHDQTFAGVLPESPVIIILMGANGWR